MGSHLARKRVVLAEDHAEMAQHLRSLLSADYNVQIVPDGEALIAAVNACVPDIVISDIAMPGISGLAAARSILATHPEVRIIFVSVRDGTSVVRKAISGGARGYVMKCDAGEELMRAVETVLDDGRYVSSSARTAFNQGL